MKILVISFEFPPQPGGIGTYTYQIAKNLYDLGIVVNVLSISHNVSDKQVQEFDKKQNFKIFRFKKYKNPFSIISHRVFKTFKIINRSDFNLLFIANYSAGVLGIIAKLFFKLPYVITGHGSEFLERSILRAKILDLVYSRSNLIILNSQYTLTLMKMKNINNSNVFVTTLGADDVLYDYNKYIDIDFKINLGLQNKFVILTVASLLPRKDHITVLKALKILNRKYDNMMYIIIGQGYYRDEIEKAIYKMELNNYVRILGYVPYEKLPYYYNACDVFILNSKIDEKGDVEGFGIVLIEANLMSKPVIGTLNSGMENAIEDGKTGLLIEMNNASKTAEAIEKMYLNPQMRLNMGKYALERAKEKYTWKIVTKKILFELKKIV